MKLYQFTNELTEKASDVYSNSDFTFYYDGEKYHVADNQKAKPYPLGDLNAVEEFLMQFAEEGEDE